MKYVVTAINRLTGKREAISSPHTRWKAEQLLLKAKGANAKKTTGLKPWLRPRVDEAVEEMEIKFSQPV